MNINESNKKLPLGANAKHIGGIKFLLILVNAGMIIGGGFIIFDLWRFFAVLPVTYICYVILLASLMAICGFLGIIGILRRNHRLIQAYGAIMLVILLVQMIDMLIAKTFNDSITQISRNNVKEKWNEEIKHPGAMDEFQTKFECCGNNSFNDYRVVLHRLTLPNSCYRTLNRTLNSTQSTSIGPGGTEKSNATNYAEPTAFGPEGTRISNKTINTEGCFTAAAKPIFNSYVVSLRANWATVFFGFILLSWIVVISKYIANKKRERDCQT